MKNSTYSLFGGNLHFVSCTIYSLFVIPLRSLRRRVSMWCPCVLALCLHAQICICFDICDSLSENLLFRTFLKFFFIASVFFIVSKEWTAKVSASCDA